MCMLVDRYNHFPKSGVEGEKIISVAITLDGSFGTIRSIVYADNRNSPLCEEAKVHLFSWTVKELATERSAVEGLVAVVVSLGSRGGDGV